MLIDRSHSSLVAYGVGSIPRGVSPGAPMALSGQEPPCQLLLNAHRNPNDTDIAQASSEKPKEGIFLKTRANTQRRKLKIKKSGEIGALV